MLPLANDNRVQRNIVVNVPGVVRDFQQIQQFDGHAVDTNHVHLILKVLTEEKRQFWPVLLCDIVVILVILANAAHLLDFFVLKFEVARFRALDYSVRHLLLGAVDAHVHDGGHHGQLRGFVIVQIILDTFLRDEQTIDHLDLALHVFVAPK